MFSINLTFMCDAKILHVQRDSGLCTAWHCTFQYAPMLVNPSDASSHTGQTKWGKKDHATLPSPKHSVFNFLFSEWEHLCLMFGRGGSRSTHVPPFPSAPRQNPPGVSHPTTPRSGWRRTPPISSQGSLALLVGEGRGEHDPPVRRSVGF